MSLFFPLLSPPPPPTLFPYTTLFRSPPQSPIPYWRFVPLPVSQRLGRLPQSVRHVDQRRPFRAAIAIVSLHSAARPRRSEEHTSELQSLTNLVCRLLLEKKKKHTKTN